MKEEILESKDVLMGTKIIPATVFPITMDGCKNWTVKAANKEIYSFIKIKKVLWITWTTRKAKQWVLDQMKCDLQN